eukprot:3924762-Prymnesium_polylepis.1
MPGCRYAPANSPNARSLDIHAMLSVPTERDEMSHHMSTRARGRESATDSPPSGAGAPGAPKPFPQPAVEQWPRNRSKHSNPGSSEQLNRCGATLYDTAIESIKQPPEGKRYGCRITRVITMAGPAAPHPLAHRDCCGGFAVLFVGGFRLLDEQCGGFKQYSPDFTGEAWEGCKKCPLLRPTPAMQRFDLRHTECLKRRARTAGELCDCEAARRGPGA